MKKITKSLFLIGCCLLISGRAVIKSDNASADATKHQINKQEPKSPKNFVKNDKRQAIFKVKEALRWLEKRVPDWCLISALAFDCYHFIKEDDSNLSWFYKIWQWVCASKGNFLVFYGSGKMVSAITPRNLKDFASYLNLPSQLQEFGMHESAILQSLLFWIISDGMQKLLKGVSLVKDDPTCCLNYLSSLFHPRRGEQKQSFNVMAFKGFLLAVVGGVLLRFLRKDKKLAGETLIDIFWRIFDSFWDGDSGYRSHRNRYSSNHSPFSGYNPYGGEYYGRRIYSGLPFSGGEPNSESDSDDEEGDSRAQRMSVPSLLSSVALRGNKPMRFKVRKEKKRRKVSSRKKVSSDDEEEDIL